MAPPDTELPNTETVKRKGQPYFVLDGKVCALLSTKDYENRDACASAHRVAAERPQRGSERGHLSVLDIHVAPYERCMADAKKRGKAPESAFPQTQGPPFPLPRLDSNQRSILLDPSGHNRTDGHADLQT